MTADNSSSNFSHHCSHSSNNCSSSGTSQDFNLTPWYTAAAVIAAVIVLLGVPANVAVIVKLGQHLRGSSMSQRLFFNLAVSDLLCLLCLPVAGVLSSIKPDLPQGVCELVSYFFCFCITCDLNILMLISIQRYYQVLHPIKWDKVGQTWRTLLIFSVWMLGALIALPVVFLLRDIEHEDTHANGLSCRNRMVAPTFEVVYVLFIAFSYLVLLFFHLLLVRGVRRAQMPNRKQPRVTKLFIRIIAVSLAAGFIPLILRVLHVVGNFSGSTQLLHVSRKLTFAACLYFFNHCLNPFLYFFASRHHRTDGNRRRCLLMPLNDNS